MDLTAYALTADYTGDVEVVLADGTPETRPKFGGGLLAVGDGDFDVAAELDAGGGTIVVYSHDVRLVALLDAYPALKRVTPPPGPKVVNPYARRDVETLRHLARIRGVPHAAGRRRLETALLRADADAHGVEPPPVEPNIDDDADADSDHGDTAHLTTDELIAVMRNDTTTFADAGQHDVSIAISELEKRRAQGDTAAAAALTTDEGGDA